MLDSLVMDVGTAFIYGEIDEEIFMKSPVGMDKIHPGSSSEDCYQLLKEYMACVKQPDNDRRNMSTQQKRNLWISSESCRSLYDI